MIALRDLATRAAESGLDIFGAFHPDDLDAAPAGTGTLILLGPREPGFWAIFTSSPEWRDGAADPLDRWSSRIIGTLASQAGGQAIFPSDGPPYPPFYRWALRSGQAFVSPVTLLVHLKAGLMVSYRGAIALPERIKLPERSAGSPCDTCDARPCLSACPPAALTASGYDLAACHGFLDEPKGKDCLFSGCAVRRACPISRGYGRLPEQSAYHMRLFHQ